MTSLSIIKTYHSASQRGRAHAREGRREGGRGALFQPCLLLQSRARQHSSTLLLPPSSPLSLSRFLFSLSLNPLPPFFFGNVLGVSVVLSHCACAISAPSCLLRCHHRILLTDTWLRARPFPRASPFKQPAAPFGSWRP